jgi:5-formyltetrahydrofolate cyclo-ligase
MREKKKVLRRELIAARREIPELQRAECDEKIARTLLSLPEYTASDTLLIYASYGEEIDTAAITKAALADGKRLAFPRCGANGIMKFYYSEPDALVPGYKNIPEPPEGAPLFTKGEHALCIVPALAIDREGFRIGYGGGFYDRFLAGFSGISVGLVRNEFFFDQIPREEFDLALNITISENGVIYNEIK